MLQHIEQIDSPRLATAAEVRALEQDVISAHGVPGIVLMKRAGRAVFARVRALGATAITVFCGSGNNAGDGFVVAALAKSAGMRVRVLCVGDVAKLPADAARAYAWARSEQVEVDDWRALTAAARRQLCASSELLIDALLGTGATTAPRNDYVDAIELLNAAEQPVLAVDLPSGLIADTGAVPGAVVRARETVTFVALKPGLLTGRGPEFVGELWFDDLDLPPAALAAHPAALQRVCWQSEFALPPRRRDAHKGDSGHVLVLGGAPGMGGAAMLAAEAALRTGAGLVSAGVAPEYVSALLARCPELMPRGLADCIADRADAELEQLLARATVLAIGPGLGQGVYGRRVLLAALATARPMVLDADALNLLAGEPRLAGWPVDAVVTPHPAEAARMLGVTTVDVQRDRLGAARALVARTGAVVVLKGAGSVIADATRLCICTDGNPGMSVGGMGDVLAGVIAALRAQGLSAFDAAVRGVCAHARAADAAVADGERGLFASDLFPWLRRLVNAAVLPRNTHE